MDQQQPGGAGRAESTVTKADWTVPQVDRLVAGRAEGNAGDHVEGLDGLS